MKKVHTLIAATLAAGMLGNQALASDTEAININAMQDAALIFAPAESKAMQLAPLSQQEMLETEGEYFNLLTATYGAVGGGFYYTTYTLASGGTWDWSGFTGSVVGGGVAGFFMNPALAATIGASMGGGAGALTASYL